MTYRRTGQNDIPPEGSELTVRKPFRPHPDEHREERRHRIPFIAKVFMLIGMITVLYFLITYAVMPVLAMLTVS